MSRRLIGFAGILLALSSTVLMQTFVSTSMPTVLAELGGISLYTWVFGGYMLATTVTVPLSGQLSDALGRRPILLTGVAVFLAGSLLSALSFSMAQLVAFRVIQGIGAGLLGTAALTAVGDLFDGESRGRSYGIANAVQVLANLAGPVAGGWVTDTIGWRWGYLLILPIAALVALGGGIGLRPPGPREQRNAVAIDWLGSGVLGLAVCLSLLGLQAVGRGALLWAGLGLLALTGPLCFWMFRLEARHPNPALPLDLFRLALFRRAAVSSFLAGVIQYGAVFSIPLLVQQVRGGTALATAGVALPMVLGASGASALSGRVIGRWPYHVITAAGLAVAALGFLWLGIMGGRGTTATLQMGALLAGLGVGLYYPSLLVAAREGAGEARASTATGVIHMARNLGGAVAVPLLGIWLVWGVDGSALSRIFYTLAAAALVGAAAGGEHHREG